MDGSTPVQQAPPPQPILGITLNSPQTPQPLITKKRIVTVLAALAAFLLIAGVGFGYFFLYAPRVQAKEFLTEAGKDFQAIQQNMASFYGSFDPLSKSFAKSQTAFFEVTNDTTYAAAITDTKQDITDITETLQLIKEAKQTKTSLQVPQELSQLNQNLDTYYDNAEKSLQLLMEFEHQQQQMLDATGVELEKQLLQINDKIQNGTPRQELIEYFNNINTLSTQTVTKFNVITPAPDPDLKAYYLTMLEHNQDLATSSAAISADLRTGMDLIAYKKIVALSSRTGARDNQRRQESKDFTTNSPIKKLFKDDTALETKIMSQFTVLKEKYDVPSAEATGAAVLNRGY